MQVTCCTKFLRNEAVTEQVQWTVLNILLPHMERYKSFKLNGLIRKCIPGAITGNVPCISALPLGSGQIRPDKRDNTAFAEKPWFIVLCFFMCIF